MAHMMSGGNADLFEISIEGSKKTRWVLIVGVQRGAYSGGSGTQYFVWSV